MTPLSNRQSTSVAARPPPCGVVQQTRERHLRPPIARFGPTSSCTPPRNPKKTTHGSEKQKVQVYAALTYADARVYPIGTKKGMRAFGLPLPVLRHLPGQTVGALTLPGLPVVLEASPDSHPLSRGSPYP
ncbi:hypothetical protein R1flu_018993 [Riccia fluitans]|uniref:Uncharacterized protein n=1 Tax=Riccia fluitans TaxID=41844 RepID=A0ABD1ZHF1_9MARC